MSWAGLANNQMVTFTNAQGGGFTLNPGESNVTSNECMTKSDALNKYQLNASSMSAYANNQLVPKSVWVGVNYYTAYSQFAITNTTTDICTISLSTATEYTTNSNGILGIGDIIYVLDVGYYPRIGGGFNYIAYLEGSSRVWVEINTINGAIISKTYCTPSITYTQIFDWYSNPCGSQATIYEGSNGLYYSDTSGTLFNGTVYIFIGFNDFGSYEWSEQIIANGAFEDNFIIESGCQP